MISAKSKIVGAALLWLLLVIPQSAAGHAFPDHSEPRVGSEVKGLPDQVKIWFDSGIEPAFSSIEVFDSNHHKVDKGDSRVDPKDPTLLEVGVPPLPPGKYEVSWSVVALDTHRTEGRFKFTVRN
jgi:methionine-rich copper-binding protein CopC